MQRRDRGAIRGVEKRSDEQRGGSLGTLDSQLYRLLAERAGGPEPAPGPDNPGWGSLRVSNARARSYGFRPRHPDVATGLRALFPVANRRGRT